MPVFNWFPVLLILMGVVGVGAYFMTKRKDLAVGILGFVMLVAILNTTGLISVGETNLPIPTQNNQNVGACEPKVISSLAWKVQEAHSNSWSAADGTINYYEKDVDPADPNASPIDTTTLTDGAGTDTSALLTTCTTYRTVIDGGSTYYDMDLGKIQFKAPDTTTSTVTLLERIPSDFGTSKGMELVGTISDLIDEASMASTDGATNTLSNDANELVNDATDSLTYDLSAGDGQFKVRATIVCNGANKVCKDMALGFEWDSSAMPEGDEVSGITAQLYTGTDLGVPSSLLNYWSSESAVQLGTLEGGVSGTYDLTFTLSESNITAGNDQFYLYIDDLGKWNGKDVELGTKATGDRTEFKFQA